MRTLEWNAESGEMIMIDQRILPARFERVICRTAEDTAEAIRNMTVRGAPAIGVSAAYGMALALLRARTDSADALWAELERAGALLTAARPTAVNLAWAVQRVLAECQPARGSAAARRAPGRIPGGQAAARGTRRADVLGAAGHEAAGGRHAARLRFAAGRLGRAGHALVRAGGGDGGGGFPGKARMV